MSFSDFRVAVKSNLLGNKSQLRSNEGSLKIEYISGAAINVAIAAPTIIQDLLVCLNTFGISFQNHNDNVIKNHIAPGMYSITPVTTNITKGAMRL